MSWLRALRRWSGWLPLAAGVAIRIAWVLSGDFEPVSESGFYHRHAIDLAAGEGYVHPQTGAPTAFLPPGYSLLLAPFYALLGPSTHVAGVVNALLAGASIGGVYVLARGLFGGRAALTAAWMIALFPSQVLYTSAVHSDHLFAAMVPWVLAAGLVLRPHGWPAWWLPVLAGVLLGLAALTAATALLLLPALVIGWAFLLPRGETVRRAGIVAVVAVAVVAPWTARNYAQLDAFVPISTNGGPNLWIGNNAGAGYGWMPWGDSQWTYPEDEVATDRELRNDALRYIAGNPLESLSRWPGKLRHTFMQDYNYVEHFSLEPRVEEMPPGMNGSLLHWIADRYYFAVLLLSACGALAPATRRGALPLVVATVALTLPTVVFFGLDRYHVPLLPIAVVPAGAAFAAVWQPVRWPDTAGRRPAAPGAALLRSEGD